MSKSHNQRRREQKAQWAENKAKVEEERKALETAQENRRKMVEAMTPARRQEVLSQLYQANLAMIRERSAQTIAVGESGLSTTSSAGVHLDRSHPIVSQANPQNVLSEDSQPVPASRT